MAPHSSTLAWKIPWKEEPGRLQSMGSLRIRHDWATSLALFTFMHWRRKWQPTPVFLPGESQGQGSLVGLPSMGSHRVGYDWSDLAAAAAGCILVRIVHYFQKKKKNNNKNIICNRAAYGICIIDIRQYETLRQLPSALQSSWFKYNRLTTLFQV